MYHLFMFYLFRLNLIELCTDCRSAHIRAESFLGNDSTKTDEVVGGVIYRINLNHAIYSSTNILNFGV